MFSFELQFKHFIPASTVNDILVNFKNIFSRFCNETLLNLQSVLAFHNLPDSCISFVLQCVKKDTHILVSKVFTNGVIRFLYAQEQYFSKNFNFVAPITRFLHLTEDGTEALTYQYVPILSQLSALFADQSVGRQFTNPSIGTDADGYEDFANGLVWKNNSLFGSGEPTL